MRRLSFRRKGDAQPYPSSLVLGRDYSGEERRKDELSHEVSATELSGSFSMFLFYTFVPDCCFIASLDGGWVSCCDNDVILAVTETGTENVRGRTDRSTSFEDDFERAGMWGLCLCLCLRERA